MSRAVSCAIDTTRLTPRQAHGALVVCCAGNLLAIGDEISKVAENIRRSLCDGDFLGIFTFGEQGCFLGVAGGHGNLMTSSIVFSD
jgi:hypothetical protein